MSIPQPDRKQEIRARADERRERYAAAIQLRVVPGHTLTSILPEVYEAAEAAMVVADAEQAAAVQRPLEQHARKIAQLVAENDRLSEERNEALEQLADRDAAETAAIRHALEAAAKELTELPLWYHADLHEDWETGVQEAANRVQARADKAAAVASPARERCDVLAEGGARCVKDAGHRTGAWPGDPHVFDPTDGKALPAREQGDPWAADKIAQSGVDTPGCDCGHDGMGRSWHMKDCAWRATPAREQGEASCAAEYGGPGYTHCELPHGHPGQHESAMGNMRRATWGDAR